jgi:hypothetical protein
MLTASWKTWYLRCERGAPLGQEVAGGGVGGGACGKGGGRKSRLSDWYNAGLPDGSGHGRITQKRQYKNQSGRDKTIFLLLKGILADFLVG